MSSLDLSGVWIPIVTPFRAGRVDHGALAALVKRLAADGVAGVVVCATTGEAPLLTDIERVEVLGTIRAATTLPLVMGASGTTADEVLRRTDAAMAHAPDAFMVTPPPYLRPSQDALRAFFTTIADGLPAPLVLYDIPARTGVRIELDTLLALAAHPRIVALKDCGGRVEQTEALIADGRLRQLTRAEDVALEKRAASSAERTRRDPAVLADLLLSPIGGLSAVSRLRP